MFRSHGAAFVVAAALLAGCTSTVAGEPTGVPTGSPADATTTGPEEIDNHGEGLPPAPLPPTSAAPSATEGPTTGRTPENLTLAVMTVFVQEFPSADAWFAAMEPFLSDQARQDWIGTDPAEIPATMLVGQPIVNAQTDYLTAMDQGTDIGVYQLLLARASDGTWIVERITPPQQPAVGG